MKLIVWNSQGGKWNVAWDDFTLKYARNTTAHPQKDDVILLLVEAGWAPWVTPGQVIINKPYRLDHSMTYYNAGKAATSSFCKAVNRGRGRKGLWIPWVGNLNAMKTNSRCSIGSGFYPRRGRMIARLDSMKMKNFIRPTIRVRLVRDVNVYLTVFVVHMVSGAWKKAQDQLKAVMRQMKTLIPAGSAAIVVGDMNIDLLKAGTMTDLPKDWSIVNTGVATQQSGGELDFGLLYDPASAYRGTYVTILEQYKTGKNGSDHSVLMYELKTKQ